MRGRTCRVVETASAGASVRFDDNRGAPNDGIVTIGLTRAACFDLRTASPDCRATVVVTNDFGADPDPSATVPAATTAAPTTTLPSTTVPDAPPATAAPAVTAAPATPVSFTPAFTG